MTVELAWELLAQVPDPELPTVSVVDLGIARSVEVAEDAVVVTITPTYSGCPAMREIEHDVREKLATRFADVEVRTVLSPAWTTDWITSAGRQKLAGSGIAPPGVRMLPLLLEGRPERCPHCGSTATEELAGFGSTACKALWRCTSCREPFDYVKAH
ncbi:MAG: phenylacetate-CoA oxygenase subunit PaaJ [Actinobacteria bacterium]|nr:phenylacetate-CoA oxygenase subunit PaaJ [Actinomycetota bacterium]MCA1721132.1 phenylacetate-CoA oxygenase subunit PaaJ [Actinomycetota bacterium]